MSLPRPSSVSQDGQFKPPTPLADIKDGASSAPFQSLMSVVSGIYDTSSAPSSPTASPKSASSFLSSSSATICCENDYEADVETDTNADEPEDLAQKYAYDFCLMSALFLPALMLGPSSMDAPWPYKFDKNAQAFARGGNGKWRSVTLLDGGVVDTDKELIGIRILVYTAQWVNAEGQTFRSTFCPTQGDIKPDDAYVRRLIEKEGIELQAGGRDVLSSAR
ncbi:hypothetical protein DFH11DRAFT_1550540 [Phellopilus nigrolimitatus]|nr:hypothetical protein DFH11DRAFT_1550540 [Phellopilus nigrolimitatus]